MNCENRNNQERKEDPKPISDSPVFVICPYPKVIRLLLSFIFPDTAKTQDIRRSSG